MEVHNDRGFAQKDASIASAVLYTLMPPGSLIVVPDSIWTHELWAAQLLGAALRGCRVYVIAPAQANAPSAGFPQLSRTRELWSRFIEAQQILGPEIAERGGRLRVGLYTREGGVDDLEAQLGEMHRTFERYPFLKEDFPFPEEFYARVGKGQETARRRRLRARRRPAAGGRARPLAQDAPEDAALRHRRRAGRDRARQANPGRDRQPDAVHRPAGDRLRARGAREGPDRARDDLPPVPGRRPGPARARARESHPVHDGRARSTRTPAA